MQNWRDDAEKQNQFLAKVRFPAQGNPPTGNRVTMRFVFVDEFNAEGKGEAR